MFGQEVLNKQTQGDGPETEIPEVCQNAVLPLCYRPFQDQRKQDMLFVNKAILDKHFKTNEVI